MTRLRPLVSRARAACAAVVLCALALGTVPHPPAPSAPGIELARQSDDADDDAPAKRHGGGMRGIRMPRVAGQTKAAPGGYDPQRVKRFWRHYHPARNEKKPRPLEHEH